MNQDNFLWGLQITDGLTMELVSQMTVIAFGVGVICFICNLAYNYLYHGASQLLSPNEDKFPDMMEIARCLVLFFCLSMYTPIARTIVGTMEVINEATSLTSDRAQEFAQSLPLFKERWLPNMTNTASSQKYPMKRTPPEPCSASWTRKPEGMK